MKKSSGSPTRMRGHDSVVSEHTVPVKTAPERRRWIGPLVAVAALIPVILMIFPCQYRQCGRDRGKGIPAYRWCVTGLPAAVLEKRPVHKQAVYAGRRKVPHQGVIPKEKPEDKSKMNAHKGDAPKEPDKYKVYDFGTKLELLTDPKSR